MTFKRRYSLLLFYAMIYCILTGMVPAVAQNTNKVWAFGQGGGIDFNTSPPTPLTTRSNSVEGCASISDANGQLRFYTWGDTVYNKNHQPMPNGDGLLNAVVIGSCTQGSLIVPDPGDTSRYYVFCLEGWSDQLYQGRLFYSVVDMNLDNGSGDVIPAQKHIELATGLYEKMTAVAGDCGTIWVVVRPKDQNEFWAFKVTASGVALNPVISSVPTTAQLVDYMAGTLKFSPDGKKAACANRSFTEPYAGVQLFDFDRIAGIFSNPIEVDSYNPATSTDSLTALFYGVCFSPDNTKLYASRGAEIYQYDISLGTPAAIFNSRTNVASDNTILWYGDMQLGPDNKIYITKDQTNQLAGFDSPNSAGIACGYNANAITLSGNNKVHLGLPNAVINPGTVSYFSPKVSLRDTILCSDGLSSLEVSATVTGALPGASYNWGPAAAIISSGNANAIVNPLLTNSVYLEVRNPDHRENCTSSDSDTMHIELIELSAALQDQELCKERPESITLHVTVPAQATILWSTGEATPSITISTPGIYWVRLSQGPCITTDTMKVTSVYCDCSIFLPNAFTPNGDGKNDFFAPNTVPPDCLKEGSYTLEVFNRWGERVYYGSAGQRGWDGNFNGQPADVGTYFFLMRYQRSGQREKIVRQGDLTLLR